MTPDQAADLAARTLAAIDVLPVATYRHKVADRERVASDLAGLRRALDALRQVDLSTTPTVMDPLPWLAESKSIVMWLRVDFTAFAEDCAAGLRRTAALYGVPE